MSVSSAGYQAESLQAWSDLQSAWSAFQANPADTGLKSALNAAATTLMQTTEQWLIAAGGPDDDW